MYYPACRQDYQWIMKIYRIKKLVALVIDVTLLSLVVVLWRMVEVGNANRKINVKVSIGKSYIVSDLPELESRLAYAPNYDVHIFYYPWYGNTEHDGKYLHWNHRYLPHWKEARPAEKQVDRHNPPQDIGSNFYPKLGTYSSRDVRVIQNHMQQIRRSGAGVLAVSWYPPEMHDGEGEFSDFVISLLLNEANKFNLKVCLHIEPYEGRNITNLKKYLRYVMRTYGPHPAFYRRPNRHGRLLPLYYIYDSYLVSQESWEKLLGPASNDSISIRGTELDGIFIGLLVERKDINTLSKSRFDGFYTYFGSDGFSYGSTLQHWQELASFQPRYTMTFIPSVAPGYIDDRIRPWNKKTTRNRDSGNYYERSFKKAITSGVNIISITSFNEWHEGTQIEEAVPMSYEEFHYLDYSPHNSAFYLQLTKKWIRNFDLFRNTKNILA